MGPLFTLDTQKKVKELPVYLQPPASLNQQFLSKLHQKKKGEGDWINESTQSHDSGTEIAEKFPAAQRLR